MSKKEVEVFNVPPEEEMLDLTIQDMFLDVDEAVLVYSKMVEFVTRVLTPSVDYGVIPGTNKPSLWKPGAEKMRRFFQLFSETKLVEKTEQWDIPITAKGYPLFSYDYVTEIKDASGRVIATCESNCNSYEEKFHWRWSNFIPANYNPEDVLQETSKETEFDFAINKAETSGTWGKPQEYWDQWKKDIEDGTAKPTKKKTRSGEQDAWERTGSKYRLPNERIYDQINTLKKMAQKRSFVGAILIATGGSEFFTQDLEDYAKHLESDPSSIYMYVPSKTIASRELINYVAGRGIDNPGEFIKTVLEANDLVFSLDVWVEVLELLDKKIDKNK